MDNSLERLQGLHADLLLFTETRLANIDRLWHELEDTLEEFRNLLDKPSSTTNDREAYNSGKISVGGQEFAINDDFKHLSRALGLALELDEIEAGKILIQGFGRDASADAIVLTNAVSSFHDRRDLLLQNLRLTLRESLNLELDESFRTGFQDVVAHILDIKTGPPSNGSLFMAKCLAAMQDIEKWQVKISEQIQTRTILGAPRGSEFYATLEFQRASLFKQHEALGCILSYLFRGNYTITEDLRKLHNTVQRSERLDLQLVHYLPAFATAFNQYASPEGSVTFEDATLLNGVFSTLKQDGQALATRPLLATLNLLWIVEYSGFFRDRSGNDTTSEDRATAAKAALDEQALEFLLSVCSVTATDAWRHPARQEMVALLLNDHIGLVAENEQTSDYFRLMIMEMIEAFAESWITNMPDTIRRLKNDEDDQRLRLLTAMQDGDGPNPAVEASRYLHMECFLVLISFAFEDRPVASELWWDDPESNLYGFLHWTAKRQTVPRVSAFCEMLSSISYGPEGAAAAHRFLLEETAPANIGRNRRVPSMNYQQIFSELELYARKVHESAPTSQLVGIRKVLPTDMNESETPVMLSCYLRLLSHLCSHSSEPRNFILNNTTLDFSRTLLSLGSGTIPAFLRASIFAMLGSLLTDKDWQRGSVMWKIIDQWISNSSDGQTPITTSANKPSVFGTAALQNTLNSISISFEQYDAFVILLNTLMTMAATFDPDGHTLPFADDLGSSYRPAGVGPYVDFVCGQVFVKRTKELSDDSQALLSSFHCLDFIASGLESFNENFVTMVDRTKSPADLNPESVSNTNYVQLHPFARLMHWITSTEMNKTLVRGIHVPADELANHSPDSPFVLKVQRSIEILILALDLQATFTDIVFPVVKDMLPDKTMFGYISIEDTIVANPELIMDLCNYAASDHVTLALRSYSLLQKLSSSSRLNNHFLKTGAATGRSRRVVDMLGPNANTELNPVSETIAPRLQFSVRELEEGHEAPAYQLKDGIVAFLNACLETQPDLPNLAHLLLGFERVGERLTISSQLDQSNSVFDAIVDLTLNYPDGEGGSYNSWLIHIKAACMQLLNQLWSSPLSQELVLGQLRRYRFLQSQFVRQGTVNQSTYWDSCVMLDESFWFTTGAEAVTEFLSYRAALYKYACQELRVAHSDRTLAVLRQILSVMLGKSIDVDGTSMNHANIFDLADFLDLDLNVSIPQHEPQHFGEINLDAYQQEATEHQPVLYDESTIRELLHMYQTQLQKQDPSKSSRQAEDDSIAIEVDSILACVEARNRLTVARAERRKTLRNYVDMTIAVLECCQMEAVAKSQFILQLLQLILPKLDTLFLQESDESIELVRLADALLFELSQIAPSASRLDVMVTDRLFQLFRTCIEGVTIESSENTLRSTLYSVCVQYLARIVTVEETGTDTHKKARNLSMDCVRSSSSRFISTLADDAEDGPHTCRLNALLLLGLLASLARNEKSTYVVVALSKANLLEVLIEPLKHVTTEFQTTEPAHRQHLLSIFEARMLLLLQISRTHDGARAMLDANFLPTIRNSHLFRTDPDLGIAIDSSDVDASAAQAAASKLTALHNYFTLIASILRVLLSVFLSRGAQNEQAQFLARSFLQDHRPNMVGLFKRYAGLGGKVEDRSKEVLADCVRSYTGLVALSGFVSYEDETTFETMRGSGFT